MTFNKHETETLWIMLVLVFILYASLLKVSQIEGVGGLLAKQADAFLAGQTHLLEPVPEQWLGRKGSILVSRADADIRYNDYLLFQDRFYLPYGPVPTLLLFLPYKYLTGADLDQGAAALVFAYGGTLLLIFLYLKLARLFSIRNDRFFRAAAFLIAAGTFIPISISWPMHYQVLQMAAYFFTALALWCLLEALSPSIAGNPWKWIAAASFCFGLAAGCRLHFALAGAAMAVPAFHWLRQDGFSRALFLKWACLALPWAICVLGLLYYNDLRFGSPWDTGVQNQITWKNFADRGGAFSTERILINLYFLLAHPIPLSVDYPFFHPQRCCLGAFGVPWQTDYDFSLQEPTYGAFTNAPFLGFCFLSLWMLRRSIPKPAAMMIGMLWIIAANILFVLLVINDTTLRYLVDFVPWLMLLACLAYAYASSQIPQRPRLHRWLRMIGIVSIAYTLACGIIYGFHGYWYSAIIETP